MGTRRGRALRSTVRLCQIPALGSSRRSGLGNHSSWGRQPPRTSTIWILKTTSRSFTVDTHSSLEGSSFSATTNRSLTASRWAATSSEMRRDFCTTRQQPARVTASGRMRRSAPTAPSSRCPPAPREPPTTAALCFCFCRMRGPSRERPCSKRATPTSRTRSRQVTRRLTLNYGLRWEAQYFPKMKIQPSAALYGQYLSDPRFPSNGRLPNQTREFQPCFGFALDILGTGRSVLRGSAGIFNARQNMLTEVGAITTNGVQQQTLTQFSGLG